MQNCSFGPSRIATLDGEAPATVIVVRSGRKPGGGMSMKRIFAFIALVSPIAFSCGVQSAGSDFIARFFGATPGKAKSFACFSRKYDPAHLAMHPNQNVAAMHLLAVLDPESGGAIDARIRVNFRSGKGALETSGSCGSVHDGDSPGEASAVHCAVDCDGGAIDVSLKTNGAVLVGIPEGARLWDPKSPDAGDARDKRNFGADDKQFRLDRARLKECMPLASGDDEKAALRRGR
jgi:hypothetical protein